MDAYSSYSLQKVEHFIVSLNWHFIQSYLNNDLILPKFIESPGWVPVLNSSNNIFFLYQQVISSSRLIIQDGKPLAHQPRAQFLGNKSTEH